MEGLYDDYNLVHRYKESFCVQLVDFNNLSIQSMSRYCFLTNDREGT